jgi:general stress protein YciG
MTETRPRGFAAMSPERRKEIATLGGLSVPASKRYYNNREAAASAGRKGVAAKVLKAQKD